MTPLAPVGVVQREGIADARFMLRGGGRPEAGVGGSRLASWPIEARLTETLTQS